MEESRFMLTVDAEAGRAVLAVVSGSLPVEDAPQFDAALQRLTASECDSLAIDFGPVGHLPSPLVAAIVRAHIRAASRGRRLNVRCSHVLAQVLRQVLGEAIDISG